MKKTKHDVAAIDIVVNIWTPEANALRPKRDVFYKDKMKVKPKTADGISLKEMLRRMDAAGTERSFLVATRAGRLGHPACYHLPYELVAKAVKQHPDRFSALAGLDPYEGMRGVRELERAVNDLTSSARTFTPIGTSSRPTTPSGTRTTPSAASSRRQDQGRHRALVAASQDDGSHDLEMRQAG